MANDILYTIGIDESGAVTGIQRVERAFDDLENETEDVQRKFRELETRLRKAEKELKDVAVEAKKTDGAFGGLGGSISVLNKGLGALGAGVSVGALASFTFDMARASREAVILGDAMGVSAGKVRGLSIAMGKVGGDISDVRGFLVATATAVDDFRQGTGPAVDEMARLGLTVDDFAGKDLYGQFTTITQAVEDFEGTTSEAVAALANMYGDEDAARIAAIGTDFEDIGTAGVEALSSIDQFWQDLKADMALGITAVATIVVNTVEGDSDGGGDGGLKGFLKTLATPFVKAYEFVEWAAAGGFLAEDSTSTTSGTVLLPNGSLYNPDGIPIEEVLEFIARNNPEANPPRRGPPGPGWGGQNVGVGGPDVTLSQEEIIARRPDYHGVTPQQWLDSYLDTLPTEQVTGGRRSGTSTIDFSAERSERAFARAFETAGVRAVREAIDSADFTLAKEQAQALYELRSTAAQSLDTEGERYLAQQQADFALQDTLEDIRDKEQSVLQDIKDAAEDSAREQLNIIAKLEEQTAVLKLRDRQAAMAARGQAASIVGGSLGEGSEAQMEFDRLVGEAETERDDALVSNLLTDQSYAQTAAFSDFFNQQFADDVVDIATDVQNRVNMGLLDTNAVPLGFPQRPIEVDVVRLPTDRPIIIQIFNDEYQRDENTIQVVQNALNGGILHVEAQDAF